MSSLFVLFGPPGVGKSYVGKILQEEYEFYFYDADEDLTPAMIEAIRAQQIFTEQMREEYFTIVCSKIKTLKKQHSKVLVTQALAKEINRSQLLQAFPEIKFILITAQASVISSRLTARNDWVTLEYADKVCKIFEIPEISHYLLDNNQDRSHIQRQLAAII